MNTPKIEMCITNKEKWAKSIKENLKPYNNQEDYLHENYLTATDSKLSEITLFKGYVEQDKVKIVYIYEKVPFNINQVVIFEGKIKNNELKGNTYLEKIQYIKEVPAPGILIFSTLFIVFLCMGWVKLTDLLMLGVWLSIIIFIDRNLTLRRGTKEIKKYIQKFNEG